MKTFAKLSFSLTAILMLVLLGACASTAPEDLDAATNMANKATTGDATSGDKEFKIDPKVQYTNMGGDNQLDQATLEIKRDINNAATGSSQFAFQTNASLKEANNMVAADALLGSYTATMSRLNALVAEAEDIGAIGLLTAQLEAVGKLYTARHDAVMERAASMGRLDFGNLTNLTVTNNSFTVAGAEAKPLPEAYATAAANIVQRVAELKARSPRDSTGIDVPVPPVLEEN